MKLPTDRRYTETHEWFLADGDVVTMGITQFAADELTDITFVELPEIGRAVTPGDTIGEVESVKATSELYSAVTGKIVAVNDNLGDHPEFVNDAAFDGGWMIKIQVESSAELEALMSPKDYTAFVENA